MFEDDSKEETIALGQRNLMSKTNEVSHLISLDFNHLNIESYHDFSDLSREKILLLAATFISIGMITGLLGPIFPFLAENLSTESHSIIRLITIKAVGFLFATYFSSYLYTWFNVCCLLGLSCLSISFAVCSLAFITDLTAFYLTALLLGVGLGLSYHGIDILYNRLWTRSSTSTIRWLHLLLVFGAILSTLILLPSTLHNDLNSSMTTNITHPSRHRRAMINDTMFSFNASSTVPKTVTKPVIVASDILSKSSYTKPPDAQQISSCIKAYCCHHQNNTLVCQENDKNQSNTCQKVFSSCRMSHSNLCYLDKINNPWCPIDSKCANETKLNCSIELTNKTINKSITKSGKCKFCNVTTVLPQTNARVQVIYRHKPPTADSDTDDLSKNFFYLKIRLFFQSITSIHYIHLLLTGLFFILGIFYSILAIRGESMNSLSGTNFNPLGLLCMKPYLIIYNSNNHTSVLSNLSSLIFAILLCLFYFFLSGIETLCIYLTYLFGIESNLSESHSLILQLCYLSGRFLDLFINYVWLLLDRYKKKSSNMLPMKVHILLRLIILFVICLTNLYYRRLYFLFFSIGFLLMSLSSLVLTWIERDLCLSEIFSRLILFTIIVSEMIFPRLFFDKIEYLIEFYLLIGLALLMCLFLMILYVSRKWQRHPMYRLVSMSMNSNDMESQENSDNERLKDTKLQ
ncbi:unnamed protein product [Adineta ricciae]|uniref:Uncharacterized protein n=1 Tax=Adineta ricciae TaxID=249248 RepID=A0A815LQN8_ADIRI|nr:unnamed protein product [Adineta ricciae]